MGSAHWTQMIMIIFIMMIIINKIKIRFGRTKELSGNRGSLLDMCQGRASLGKDTFDGGDHDDDNDHHHHHHHQHHHHHHDNHHYDMEITFTTGFLRQNPRGVEAEVETAICKGGGNLSGEHKHKHIDSVY